MFGMGTSFSCWLIFRFLCYASGACNGFHCQWLVTFLPIFLGGEIHPQICTSIPWKGPPLSILGAEFQDKKWDMGHSDLKPTHTKWTNSSPRKNLGGGFNLFNFHHYLGKIPILTNIFQRSWNHQVEKHHFNKKERMVFQAYILEDRLFSLEGSTKLLEYVAQHWRL